MMGAGTDKVLTFTALTFVEVSAVCMAIALLFVVLPNLRVCFLISQIEPSVQKVICLLYKSLKMKDKRNDSEEDG